MTLLILHSKNPGCKMLFRTEEEEDRSISASRSRRRSRSIIPTPSSLLLTSLSCQDEEEDKPGLFKRVIMRITKNISMVTNQKDGHLNEDYWYHRLGPEGFVQPSLWGSTDPTLPISYLPSGTLAQISNNTILPAREDQQVREGNIAGYSTDWEDFSHALE